MDFEISGNYKNLKNRAEVFWLLSDGDYAEIDIEDFNNGVITGKLNMKLTQAGTENSTLLKGTFSLPITGCH